MMEETMYIVRFVRKDGHADEEYYYHSRKDAEYHLSLFENDDSGLYLTVLCLYQDACDKKILRIITYN